MAIVPVHPVQEGRRQVLDQILGDASLEMDRLADGFLVVLHDPNVQSGHAAVGLDAMGSQGTQQG